MKPPHTLLAGRYTILREIASGGMATVYLGRLAGPGGFSRPVAIKRPHEHVARHPEFRAMLLDEGRLAASISHPNVVSTLDVVADGDDLFLVMDYIPGHTLSEAQRSVRKRGTALPPPVACAIVHDVLLGLSAVHEARDDRGAPLGIVHRDISPQNILIGRDGVARVLDFGVAKAAGRLQETRDGQLKGKIAYMAPEQMQGNVTSRTDVYAASIVLWEALTGERLFTGDDEVAVFSKALTSVVSPPSRSGAKVNALDAATWEALDAVVLRGLSRDPSARFASAREMAMELARCLPPAGPREVSAWLESEIPIPSTEPAAPEPGTNGATVVDPTAAHTAPMVTESADDAVPRQVQAQEAAAAAVLVPRPSRRATWGIAVAAASLAITALAFLSRGTTPATPVVAATAAAAAPSVATPPDVAFVPAPPAPVLGSAPPATSDAGAPAHAHPAAKNRVEHPKRPPVASQTIDVSHAIDARH